MRKLSPTQEAMLRRLVEGRPYDRPCPQRQWATLRSLRRLNFVWGYEVTDEGRAALKTIDDARKGKR